MLPPKLETDDASLSPTPNKRRRTLTRAACAACRTKKRGCDGQRPVCGACAARDQPCVYFTRDADETRTQALARENEELKQELKRLEQRLSDPSSLQDSVGKELLHRVRSADSVPEASGQASGYSLFPLSPLAQATTPASLVPAIGLRFESELSIAYPDLYPMPWKSNAPLRRVDLSRQQGNVPAPSVLRALPNSRHPDKTDLLDLSNLQMGNWTNIPVSNDFAAKALGLYFQTDHPVLGLFDAALFVNDLLNARRDFCSTLLVNSLLFWACQAYTAFNPVAAELSMMFHSEAQYIWHADRSDDPLSAAALQYLCVGCSAVGKDDLAAEYLQEGTAMATRLGLINMPSSAFQQSEASRSQHRSTSHIAWGIFNWLTLRSAHYREKVVVYPPNYPIPGDDGQGSFCNTSNDPLLRTSHTFYVLCKLWRAVQEFAAVYYGDHTTAALVNRVSQEYAESIYRSLLSWAGEAATALRSDEGYRHHVACFYIFFHTIVIEIFRPFAGASISLASLEQQDSRPRRVIAASLKQLEWHLVTFPLAFPAASYTIFWHPVCLYIANAALAGVWKDQWRSRFLLCVRAYQKLSRCFHIARTILKSLLAIAVSKGAFSPAEAKAMLDAARSNTAWPENLANHQSAMKVDLELAIKDPRAADIATLCSRLDDFGMD